MNLGRYFLKRLLFAAITFFVIVSVIFFLVRATPGGPFDGERSLTPEIEANLLAAYNLDQPIYMQYLDFLQDLLRGDLGPSFRQKDFRVNELIASGLPISAALGGIALILALGIGVTIGTLAGFGKGSRLDRILMAISNINLSVPSIVSAPLFVLIFSITFAWLPAGGADTWHHYILPACALALPFSAEIARLVRGGVAQVALEPFVQTAKAKGLSDTRITLRHIMPSAVTPLISYLAPATAGLLTGTVVIEQVFDIPGIGRYFVEAALARDYTLVMGVTIVYAFAILLFNLLADLLYGVVDPRIRVNDS